MQTEILIVEDDADIADIIEFMLKDNGYVTSKAHDGDLAAQMFSAQKPDLVLLDLSLPGVGGVELFHRFRRESPNVPIIMVTSRTDDSDRISGLEMGADDYITKPFNVRELLARVRAVLRRSIRSQSADSNLLSFGKLCINRNELRVEYAKKSIELSSNDVKMLECFVKHPAMVYRRDVLISAIHGGDVFISDRAIDAQVKRIRRAFSQAGAGVNPIATVYGVGYKLDLPDERS
jgi:DNA-binding response OmpR family regulator